MHMPPELSVTIGAARVAAERVADRIRMRVIDSGTAAMGLGFVALAAAARRAHDAGEGVWRSKSGIGRCTWP